MKLSLLNWIRSSEEGWRVDEAEEVVVGVAFRSFIVVIVVVCNWKVVVVAIVHSVAVVDGVLVVVVVLWIAEWIVRWFVIIRLS